jgi:hypothetical protein
MMRAMVDKWIAGADNLIDERIAYADANGLSPRIGATYRLPNAPWRFVGHTVEAPEDNPDTAIDEGWELDQYRGYVIRHRTPPHLWAAPEHDWVGQTVPLTLSAYALRHEAGDPETNHAHAIQLELLAYARNKPYTTYADWIGERIIRPLLDAGVPLNLDHLALTDDADAYGEDGTVRMTWAQWAAFDGLCGHQNVPGNSHWDPGIANWAKIAQAAGSSPPPKPAPTGDKMLYLVKTEANPGPGNGAWVTDWITKRKVDLEDIAVVKWLTAKAGAPISTDGGRAHLLGPDQADVLDRIPTVT